MFENFLLVTNINYILVFLEGILSFFSPCILPLIPIYLGYLAGNTKQLDENGEIIYKRKTVLINTILFVFGISIAFFILGMSFSALGSFFNENKKIIINISGIVIIIMGVIQLGVFKINFFQKEHKINVKLNLKKMNPMIAFILGFTFSFAWTPCIGPALASVLVLASSSTNVFMGNILVFVYTLGFIIPFILLGIFTTQVLNFIKSKPKIFNYTVKIAAVILIIIGTMIITGYMDGINAFLTRTGNLNSDNNSKNVIENTIVDNNKNEINSNNEVETKKDTKTAYDFSLVDQYGEIHTLSEYKGKVVFLNFWTTWCPPCKEELPHIEEIYKQYGYNKEDVIIIGITNPQTSENRNAEDVSKEEIIKFLNENKYTFPVVFDESGKIFENYAIRSFPTTFMIDKQGNVFGYIKGKMEKTYMKDIIEQTISRKRRN